MYKRQITQVAVELLRAYAPPRPVRLLGAALLERGDADAERGEDGQLALPV